MWVSHLALNLMFPDSSPKCDALRSTLSVGSIDGIENASVLGKTFNCVPGWASTEVGYANDFIDEVFQNLRNEESIVEKLEPIKLPDIDEGNFKASKLELRGVSSVYRSGDCTISYDGETVKVTGAVGVKGIRINLNYQAKSLFVWIKGKVTVTVTRVTVKFALSAVDGKAKLNSFKVTYLGEYKIEKITGMNVVMNWIVKLIANSVAKASKRKITDTIEGIVSQAVDDILAKIELPIKAFSYQK